MEPTLLGQIAALAAAVCWSISAPCFTLAGRRIGSLPVNIYRLAVAGVVLCVYGWVVRGLFLPTDATPAVYGWLIASGLVGFFLCDLCLFKAFLLLGPRLAMLIFAMAPPLSAMLDWYFRDVTLTRWSILGMIVTLAGIAWVVLERRGEETETVRSQKKLGVILASIAAVCHATGMIFADVGLTNADGTPSNYDAFAATQIRLFAGLAAFLLTATLTRRWRSVLAGAKDPWAITWLSIGAVLGPFLGVGFGLISLKYIPTGVAMTLMALPPVFILPVARFLLQEKITLRATFGAIVAVAGMAVLFSTRP